MFKCGLERLNVSLAIFYLLLVNILIYSPTCYIQENSPISMSDFRHVLSFFEPMTRIELVTSSLPRKHSTPELHRQRAFKKDYKRAGDETRTRDPQLGRLTFYQLSYSRFYFFIKH